MSQALSIQQESVILCQTHHFKMFVLRFRTWEAWGQLVAVTSQHGRDLAAIHLLNSHVCLQMRLHPAALTHLCLSEVPLADGEWHTVYVHRRVIQMDR